MEKHKKIIDELIERLNQSPCTKGAEVKKVSIDDDFEFFASYSVVIKMAGNFVKWDADSFNKVVDSIALLGLNHSIRIANFTDREKAWDGDRYHNAWFSIHFCLDK